LVPCDFPVGVFVLIKIDSTHHPRSVSKNRVHDGSQCITVCEVSCERHCGGQIPQSESFSCSLTGEVIDFQVLQFFFEQSQLVAVDCVFKNRKPVSFDLPYVTHQSVVCMRGSGGSFMASSKICCKVDMVLLYHFCAFLWPSNARILSRSNTVLLRSD